MILISACLTGAQVRYDGSHKLDRRLRQLVEEGKAISACPEVLGGLSTPRDPAEIVGGDGNDVWTGQAQVRTIRGEDVTAQYKAGALQTLRMVQELNCDTVILKSKSPSCGSIEIYDGTFTGSKKVGNGVVTALLKQYDIKVYDEISFFKR
ncbi:DUF523 domain-containing protein [Staphylococcus sp. SQ8-PEA]|uniref:DUF523 domain-containing protein n=1 Tax=Staphylococcus marylandisciuri TaxID=2981529 RepID=A0ABT2QQU3_9STAP|nr:DUF523 domain-containing protein [Staphylococcus marylandisciuri]MCU5746318.1 DUF523 domain-containing protein [Staphylococcus marylandisciuri]